MACIQYVVMIHLSDQVSLVELGVIAVQDIYR